MHQNRLNLALDSSVYAPTSLVCLVILGMDLSAVLASLNPKIQGKYVYCYTKRSIEQVAPLNPLITVQEGPDLTLVLSKRVAEQNGFEVNESMAYISLGVDTELELVGFTAIFSTALGKHGISANVVAGYHQDHLFVQWGRRDEAIEVLKSLKNGQQDVMV